MPTNAEPLLLDTSAAIALIDPANAHNPAVGAAVKGRPLGLSGHAAFETLSVLTRLPAPSRMAGSEALRLIEVNFPESRFLSAEASRAVLAEFVAKDIIGGAVWDALVGCAARAHGLTLVTCDRRARPTYDALGLAYRIVL